MFSPTWRRAVPLDPSNPQRAFRSALARAREGDEGIAR